MADIDVKQLEADVTDVLEKYNQLHEQLDNLAGYFQEFIYSQEIGGKIEEGIKSDIEILSESYAHAIEIKTELPAIKENPEDFIELIDSFNRAYENATSKNQMPNQEQTVSTDESISEIVDSGYPIAELIDCIIS